jgi:hypothetical protein
MRLVVAVVALVGVAAAHPWSCYQADPQHSGLSEHRVGDSLWPVWTYPAGGDVSGSAVVNRRGQVIFGARNVHLYCLEPGGALAWDANLESLGTSIYFSTPALDDDGSIYITTNRKLVKLDSAGTVLWRYPAHNSWSISHSPVVGPGGTVYFGNYSDSLYAMRPDGSLDWAHDLGRDCNSAPAVGPGGRVYVATTRGEGGWKLWALTPGGTVAWAFDLAGQADFASPAVGPDSTVYVGAGRYLYAVRHDGSGKWRDSLSANINSCPAVANDSTLYVTAGAYLYRVSTDSGVRWRKSLGGSNYSAPAVDADGRVFVGSASSTSPALFAFAPDSSTLGRYPTPDQVWASPAIGPAGRVYVGCMDGSFHAFEGSGLALAGDDRPGRHPGLAIVPNPTSGRLRLAGPAGIERADIRVVNAAGRAVAGRSTGGELDLGGLPAGVYVIEARLAGETARGRVVLR